ncbi:MAG TPA: hypothetical protein VGG34_08370 [Opitutaceae bacterium]|jgi:hypothetical protein
MSFNPYRFLGMLAGVVSLFPTRGYSQTAAPTSAPSAQSGASVVGTATTNPSNAANVTTTPKAQSISQITEYNLSLGWNEALRGISLAYTNSSATALSIRGVQSTANIFVVSYPSSIPAGGSGAIEVVYLAQAGMQADSDLVRLLTSDGVKLLRLAHGSPSVATLSTNTLTWQLGEALTPKSVTLSLLNGEQATAVTQYDGSTATLTSQNAGTYVVTVTPFSTATADHFPAIVTLSPAVPNTTLVVDCVVGSAN